MRHPDPAAAAVGTAAGTGVISYLAQVNWIGIGGLLLSAAWLVLAIVREVRENHERHDRHASH